MLSILITVYNQGPEQLIKDLLKQLSNIDYPVEIIIGNDCSDAKFMPVIEALDKIPGVKCLHSPENLGRSKIRNWIGSQANYPYLLFIDGDAMVKSKTFISDYLSRAEQGVVICGGTAYSEEAPTNKAEILRWKYGIKKEARSAYQRGQKPYNSFSSFNFLMPAELFNNYRFREDIQRYGHEDTLLGIDLEKAEIPLVHIDNQLIHNGLYSAMSIQ